ncbi:hypothetical protein BDV97DRAFT_370973 [Delphinella strobiligena]|nr:hypothetical protein BDV97DRAFT_370973 [Delphinella strobiligena]
MMLLFLSYFFLTPTQAEQHPRLSAAITSASGYFTSPNSSVQAYSIDDMMNISWIMTGGDYTSFDLYLVPGHLFSNAISIKASASKNWYNWEVDASNLSLPFLFHIVDANGTMDEKHAGGFESAQFWITPGTIVSSSSTEFSSTIISSTISSTATSHSTSTSETSPSTILRAPSTVSSTTSAMPTSSSPPETAIAGKLSIAVGAGLAIGLALVSSVASIYLWRRRSRAQSVHEKLLDEASQWSGSEPPSRARSPLPKKPIHANYEGRSPLLQKPVHIDYETRLNALYRMLQSSPLLIVGHMSLAKDENTTTTTRRIATINKERKDEFGALAEAVQRKERREFLAVNHSFKISPT